MAGAPLLPRTTARSYPPPPSSAELTGVSNRFAKRCECGHIPNAEDNFCGKCAKPVVKQANVGTCPRSVELVDVRIA